MFFRTCCRAASTALLAIIAALCFSPNEAWSQEFIPTEGVHTWNEPGNWSPATIPNASGAAATVPERVEGPTDDLTVTVDSPVTIGSLTLRKATGGLTGVTTIAGPATLTFDNGGSNAMLTNGTAAVGTGATIIAAPLVLNSTLAVSQADRDPLQFTGSLSGSGGLTISRVGTGGLGQRRMVILSNANDYAGNTVLTGLGAQNYLLVRLDDAEAIPTNSNITVTNSVVLGLNAGDFTRAIGTGAGEFQNVSTAQTGWAAFGEDRAVNIYGDGRRVFWGSAVGTDPPLGLNLGQLVLGHPEADATIVFENELALNSGGGNTSRMIRVLDGAAAIDARITGSIVTVPSSDPPSPSPSDLTFVGDGRVSLEAANTYVSEASPTRSGATNIDGPTVILNHPQALSPNTNLLLTGSGSVLGLGFGNDEFTLNLGTAAGEVQLTGTNAGFAAYGGDRVVRLNNNNVDPLVWGSSHLSTNLILSDDEADGTLIFENPIDLSGVSSLRFNVRNGNAAIDARLTGELSGTGGLEKNLGGGLELSAANTYQGVTTILSGTLVLTHESSIPGGINGGNTANISIESNAVNTPGTIGLGHGDFTSALGSGPGQIRFTNHGGFAAYGADRVVNLGGASEQVVWGVGDFVTGELGLGAAGADGTLDFQNPIDLNGPAERRIFTRDGPAVINAKISNVISGSGSVWKRGAGTLALTADNTYDGDTTVANGRLLVNNTTGSGTGSGDVHLIFGTPNALGGTGTIGGNLIVDAGRLQPGDASEFQIPGELTVGGNVTFVAAGTPFLDIELASGGHDTLTVGGAATLAGTLTVSLLGGFAPTPGMEFTILSAAGGVSGTFSSLDLPGPDWQVDYLANSVVLIAAAVGLPGDLNGDGVVDARDYVFWRKNAGTQAQYDQWRANFGTGSGNGAGALQAVPEPATLVLLALLAPLVLLRRIRGGTEHGLSS